MENVCRTCLRIPDKLLSIFDDLELPYKIATISDVQVLSNDKLPTKICEECVKNINLSYNFRKVIRNSDLELRERYAALENNKIIEPFFAEHKPTNLDVKTESLGDNLDTDGFDAHFETTSNAVTEATSAIKFEVSARTRKNIAKDLLKKQRHSLKNMITYRKKMYECKKCNFSCTEMSKWQNHKRTKHYDQGICNVCGKSIRTDNLNKHIKSHTEQPVTCTECGKVFKNKESLRSHSLVHSGPELVCTLCGKSYRYRGEYNRHLKRHTSNDVKTVKCSICEKMFHDKKHVKKHMQTHTGERPHICKYCNKGFSSTYALKTHTRQHTNEKPYICEYCPMAFPQKVSLMTHIKSKHGQVNT